MTDRRDWKSPRETLYKGVRMRSRLEAGFAMWCDDWGIKWSYEPICLANEKGQWLPDFVLETWWLKTSLRVEPVTFVVEVKPEPLGATEVARLHSIEEDSPVVSPNNFSSATMYSVPVLATPQGLSQMISDGGLVPLSSVGFWHHKLCGGLAFAHAENIDARPWQGEWWKG